MRGILWLLVWFVPCAAAAAPLARHALPPGPFAVGYRVIEQSDPSRRYGDARRPEVFSVWYPAVPDAGALPVTYREYVDDAGRAWGGVRQAELRAEALADLAAPLVGSIEDPAARRQRLEALLAAPAAAHRDAPSAPGRFPVVLHVPGTLTQSILLEHLASWGYVVLAVPLYNGAPAFYGRGDDTAASLLDTVADLALMLHEAARIPGADADRAAVIGMFAQAGLALQMRGGPLRAVACLECGAPGTLEAMPFYDPARVRVPILELRSSSWTGPLVEPPSTKALRGCQRFVGRVQGIEHGDFYPFATLAGTPGAAARHGAVAFLVRRFLDLALRDDATAESDLRGPLPIPGLSKEALSMRVLPAEELPPTAAEFLGWLRFGPIDRARAAWQRFGPAIVSRDRMFATVLFLARDGAPQANEAAAMFRGGFPPADDAQRRQDAMLSSLLDRK